MVEETPKRKVAMEYATKIVKAALKKWDPLQVGKDPDYPYEVWDEYQTYGIKLAQMIVEGSDAQILASYLSYAEKECMEILPNKARNFELASSLYSEFQKLLSQEKGNCSKS
jgi:hypothetical protein